MTVIVIEFCIVILGMALTAVLFHRFPVLPGATGERTTTPSISVIIPARNEEENLPLLLRDLSAQSATVREIIVVDDMSEDGTARVARENGAKLIRPDNKPEGWTGKTWACQNGADAAAGEILLFLDADVRLDPDGICSFVEAFRKAGCVISVQPYHRTEKLYEQFSIIFNLIQIAANGTTLPRPLDIGLYGPVILISRSDYEKVGGHESVRQSVVEDMALGTRLRETGVPYRIFIGSPSVSFRMYASGFRDLLQGWTKNIASGAARIPIALFAAVFFWIASLLSVPIQIIKFSVSQNWPWLLVYVALYLVWVLVLIFLARRVGRFKPWTIVFYPVLMLLMTGVFIVSAFKKLFGLKVKWKGRAIATGEKQ
ncbi:MAG: glycosyltransferase [Clostridiales bacterium]|nr:glycosyltransferase [Clostridiales bacterium]